MRSQNGRGSQGAFLFRTFPARGTPSCRDRNLGEEKRRPSHVKPKNSSGKKWGSIANATKRHATRCFSSKPTKTSKQAFTFATFAKRAGPRSGSVVPWVWHGFLFIIVTTASSLFRHQHRHCLVVSGGFSRTRLGLVGVEDVTVVAEQPPSFLSALIFFVFWPFKEVYFTHKEAEIGSGSTRVEGTQIN